MRVPLIKFCRTSRGQRIAYAVHGDGPALVCPAWWVSHLERDWSNEKFRAFFSALGEHFRVYRYDRVGVGLSDRERDVFELVDEVEHLTAVVEANGLERISFFGISCAGPAALVYAFRHPERVDKIALYGSYIAGAEIGTPDFQRALYDLVRAHWGLGSRAFADLLAPELTKDEIARMSEDQQISAAPDAAAGLLRMTFSMAVREVASRVEAPTLVVHRRADKLVAFELGRDLAATLPNATLVGVDGDAHIPWEGEMSDVLEPLLRFLTGGRAQSTRVDPGAGARLSRQGDVWEARFGQEAIHIKHSKGVADLAILLANPGQVIPARDLVAGVVDADLPMAPAEPLLDEAALATLRSRARNIDQSLDEAEANADIGRMAALRLEHEALLDELGRCSSLGGRSRSFASEEERARKAVSARIKAAISKIESLHPALGRHLTSSIVTGMSCWYVAERSAAWHVTTS